MYGLLIEGVINMIKTRYGEETLIKVREISGVQNESFIFDRRYSERTLHRLTKGGLLSNIYVHIPFYTYT